MRTKLIFPPGKSTRRHYHLLPIRPQLVDMNFLFQFVIGISTEKKRKRNFVFPNSMTKKKRERERRNLIRMDKKKTNFSLSCFPQCRIIVKRVERVEWSFLFSLNRIINEEGSWKLVSLIRVTRCFQWKSIKEWNDFRGWQQEKKKINDRSFFHCPRDLSQGEEKIVRILLKLHKFMLTHWLMMKLGSDDLLWTFCLSIWYKKCFDLSFALSAYKNYNSINISTRWRRWWIAFVLKALKDPFVFTRQEIFRHFMNLSS